MNADKLLAVIAIYRKNFIRKKIEAVDFSHIDKPIKCEEILSHCHGMLNKMEKFVLEGRIEKAFKWLGFVQGCLWSAGYYSLEDLKNHNRPTIEKFLGE
jgi:methionine salvage enolase-phosphatase E1